MKETNIALIGKKTQSLNLINKLGALSFVFGLLSLIDGHFTQFLLNEKISVWIGFANLFLGSIGISFENESRIKFLDKYFISLNNKQKIGLLICLFGLIPVFITWFGEEIQENSLVFIFVFTSLTIGVLTYTLGNIAKNHSSSKNNNIHYSSLTNRGVVAWIIGVFLTLFYIQLYWFPDSLKFLINIFDPLSQLIRGKNADQWFMYGTFYTFVILILGVKFCVKYRKNKYQLIRTIALIFSQLVFAYFLPYILEALNLNSSIDSGGEYLGYYSANPVNAWPLNYDFFSSSHLKAYTQTAYQPIAMAFFIWGIILFLLVAPIITYFVGKRWYCSWICGCGGLAETAGDSFRHLSSKSITSWKIERWIIHSILLFVLLMTIAITYSYFSGNDFTIGFVTIHKNIYFIITSILLIVSSGFLFFLHRSNRNKILLIASTLLFLIFIFLVIAFITGEKNVFMIKSTAIKKAYGFFVGSAFSGVIGVGFYPILGNRVWCRFGCPMAGYLGIFQRFKSRFRITTNGGQCISCGNCSTYCEQGIDVRAYAQKGQNIVRSSCVGCGICADVCPRGVLKLENGPEEGRIVNEPYLIGMLDSHKSKK